MMKVYVVGKYVKQYPEGPVWEIAGIYLDKLKAELACVDESHFVGPVPVNEPLPLEKTIWPGTYYPLCQAEPLPEKEKDKDICMCGNDKFYQKPIYGPLSGEQTFLFCENCDLCLREVL